MNTPEQSSSPDFDHGIQERSSLDNSVCPRHPDRPSLIRCQRCDLPACTECQRRAAVGIHCIDCVNGAAEAQRATAPRTAIGAPAAMASPTVTISIMVLCGAIYVLQFLGLDPWLTQHFMFGPAAAIATPWTFITSGFLHGSIAHVALNLYALWAVGQFLERVLGHWRYLAVFLLSVIGGHALVLLLAPFGSDAWFTGTVGASGGLFGLFGALLIVQRKLGADVTQVIVLIALNFGISFIYPNISWQGHLGGLIVGTATVGLLFALRPKATPGADRAALAKKSALIHSFVCAAVFFAIVAVCCVKWFFALQAGVPIYGDWMMPFIL